MNRIPKIFKQNERNILKSIMVDNPGETLLLVRRLDLATTIGFNFEMADFMSKLRQDTKHSLDSNIAHSKKRSSNRHDFVESMFYELHMEIYRMGSALLIALEIFGEENCEDVIKTIKKIPHKSGWNYYEVIKQNNRTIFVRFTEHMVDAGLTVVDEKGEETKTYAYTHWKEMSLLSSL